MQHLYHVRIRLASFVFAAPASPTAHAHHQGEKKTFLLRSKTQSSDGVSTAESEGPQVSIALFRRGGGGAG